MAIPTDISEDVISNLHKREGYAVETIDTAVKTANNFKAGRKWQKKLWLLLDSPESGL